MHANVYSKTIPESCKFTLDLAIRFQLKVQNIETRLLHTGHCILYKLQYLSIYRSRKVTKRSYQYFNVDKLMRFECFFIQKKVSQHFNVDNLMKFACLYLQLRWYSCPTSKAQFRARGCIPYTGTPVLVDHLQPQREQTTIGHLGNNNKAYSPTSLQWIPKFP